MSRKMKEYWVFVWIRIDAEDRMQAQEKVKELVDPVLMPAEEVVDYNITEVVDEEKWEQILERL